MKESLEARHDGTGDAICERLPDSRPKSSYTSRDTCWENPTPLPSTQNAYAHIVESTESFDLVDLNSDSEIAALNECPSTWNNLGVLGLSAPSEASLAHQPLLTTPRFMLDDSGPISAEKTHRPFDKWMRTLHLKATLRRNMGSREVNSDASGDTTFTSVIIDDAPSRHKKSVSSSSSMGFVTAVKSASVSLASFSVAPRSRRTGVSPRHRNRSSKTSNPGTRLSEDSIFTNGGIVIDEDVVQRSIQRRKVIEEIISTEEGYLGDIRFLMNVR
jgi:hypothetical protein